MVQKNCFKNTDIKLSYETNKFYARGKAQGGSVHDVDGRRLPLVQDSKRLRLGLRSKPRRRAPSQPSPTSRISAPPPPSSPCVPITIPVHSRRSCQNGRPRLIFFKMEPDMKNSQLSTLLTDLSPGRSAVEPGRTGLLRIRGVSFKSCSQCLRFGFSHDAVFNRYGIQKLFFLWHNSIGLTNTLTSSCTLSKSRSSYECTLSFHLRSQLYSG